METVVDILRRLGARNPATAATTTQVVKVAGPGRLVYTELLHDPAVVRCVREGKDSLPENCWYTR